MFYVFSRVHQLAYFLSVQPASVQLKDPPCRNLIIRQYSVGCMYGGNPCLSLARLLDMICWQTMSWEIKFV